MCKRDPTSSMYKCTEDDVKIYMPKKWGIGFFLLILASISVHNRNASATILYTRGQCHHAFPQLTLCGQSGSCAD